jgi:hypothetical protein
MLKNLIKAVLWIFILLLLALNSSVFQCNAEAPVKILSAYGTSSSDNSKSVTDLLDLKEEGSWKPKCLDSGVDEGLFFQFTTSVFIDFIEVKFKAKQLDRSMLTFYLDGKRNVLLKKKSEQPEEEVQDNGLEYWAALKPGTNYNICRFGARGGYDFGSLKPLNTKVQSFFIKISRAEDIPEILSVRFFRKDNPKPLPVVIPKWINGKVTATSTLEPATAYNVLNLFDSQLDFAWATDGKKTTGTGESFTIVLDKPLELSGLMLWNGYQRSATHYYANSRAAKLKISLNNQKEFSLELKDKMGAQTLLFPQPADVTQLTVTITGIYPGNSYKDMVLSDLKLIDASGDIVILNTRPPAAVPGNPLLKRILDSSIANFLGWLSQQEEYHVRFENTTGDLRLRLRSNHSFVLYYHYESQVMEGNWEEQTGGIRIFGKKYTTNRKDSMYLSSEKKDPQAEIFQADIKIIDPAKLSYGDIKGYLKTILAGRGFYDVTGQINPSKPIVWRVDTKDDNSNIKGNSDEELCMGTYQFAVKHKALLLVSPLFTDLFLPSDQVSYYTQGYVIDDGP